MANLNDLRQAATVVANETQKKANTAMRIGTLFLNIIDFFWQIIKQLKAVSVDVVCATNANVVLTPTGTQYTVLKADIAVALAVYQEFFIKSQTTASEIGVYRVDAINDTTYTITRTYTAKELTSVFVAQGVNEGCWHRDGNGITTPFVRIQNGDYYDAAHVTNPAFADITATDVAGQLTQINTKATTLSQTVTTQGQSIATINTQVGDINTALTGFLATLNTINNLLA